MIDDLGEALTNEAVRLHCQYTIQELRTFTRGKNGKMGGSPYDDRTISLAIAVQMLAHVHLAEYRIKPPKHAHGTWGALLDKLFPLEKTTYAPSGPVIGAHSHRRR